MKQSFRTIYASAVVAAMVLTASPVAAKKKTKASIKSVTVTNLPAKTLTLKKGKSKTLKFKVTKTGKISTALAYKTSNKKIVTVSKKGVVKAKKKGKAKVTAYAKKNKKKKVVITVTVGTPVTKVKLNKSKVTVYKGKTYTLKATITPKKASNKKVVWKTSNKKIAKVSSKGKVTAVKAGKAKITATAADGSGKKATATVTVKNKSTKKTVTATAAASATVQDPRNISLTLNQAQALDKSQITVQSKSSESANFRYTNQIKSISTTDNVNYTILLKKNNGIDDDDNVRVTVTGLANNPAASTVETYYSGLVTSRTNEETIALESGSRTSVSLDIGGNSYSDYYKYEVTSGALPAGMQRDEKAFGAYDIYGTPTANSDITIKRTAPHGDTVTTTYHFKLYSKDAVALEGTNTYNLRKTVNTHSTDTVADDTLNDASVSVYLNADGGQTYRNYGYVKKSDGTYLSWNDYYDQRNKAGQDARDNEADKYESFYSYETTGSNSYSGYLKKNATEKQASDDDVKGIVDSTGNVKYYDSSDILTNDDYYSALNKAESNAESAFADQYEYTSGIGTKYEIVGDAHGLTINDSNYLTGSLASSATVTVKATKKNTAGAEVSDTMTLNLNVEDAKLVKGTVTDINGKAVKNARVNFSNRKADSAFTNNNYYYYDGYYYSDPTTNDAGQYSAAVENSTYYVTAYKNQSDTFTKDVVINADNGALNFGVGGVAVTLAPTTTDAYVPSELYDDNDYTYTVDRIYSDTNNDGDYDHLEGYQVVLENNTAYNLVSPNGSYSTYSNGTETITDYNATVSLTTNGNAVTSAVLNINKK